MLALKLKLDPTPEQMVTLDKMFWKWASICSRISAGKATIKELAPPENASGIWFSKTQLNQAKTDVDDLSRALKKNAKQYKQDLLRQEKRASEIKEAIENIKNRDVNPARPSTFRIKKWAEKPSNLTKRSYHTLKYWRDQLEKLEKTIQKRKKTIEKIEKAIIRFKPKRITLHKSSFLISFGKKLILLKPFARAQKYQSNLDIRLITEPMQPIIGSKGGKSSARSKEFLEQGILNFISFALDRLFFGMNDHEKKLLKTKEPDKITKRDEMLAKKKEKFETEKLPKLKKILGRELSEEEKEILKKENEKFFANFLAYTPSSEYKSLLKKLAIEVFKRNEYISLERYPILLRKPINKFRTKKLSNLKPDEWEYFLQVSYEHFGADQISPKTVMGIDRGIKHLLAVAVFDPESQKFTFNKLIKNPVLSWKNRIKNLKNAITRRERRIRAATGEHIKENQLKKRIKKIENCIENFYHNVAANIVKTARHYHSVIVFESLERRGIKQHGRSKGKRMKRLNYILSNFDYAKIAALINYKAHKEGVPVFEILPAYTSQNCAKCLIESGKLNESADNYSRERANPKIGYCKKHGYIDADLNAARTIAICYFKKLNEPGPFNSRK
jgi:IS605 OrfB family transposase